tara:strand:- start:741 stop:1028 length:288 start_codon:yes stop_codon:yes gene_type:complete
MTSNYLGLSTNMGKKGNPIENISIEKLRKNLTKEYNKDYVNQTDMYNFLDENEDVSLFIQEWIKQGMDMGYIDLTQQEEVMDWIRVLTSKKIEVV